MPFYVLQEKEKEATMGSKTPSDQLLNGSDPEKVFNLPLYIHLFQPGLNTISRILTILDESIHEKFTL